MISKKQIFFFWLSTNAISLSLSLFLLIKKFKQFLPFDVYILMSNPSIDFVYEDLFSISIIVAEH